MANPNPSPNTRFQKGNQMAKLSIGKKRKQLTAAFLNVYDAEKLEEIAKQLYAKAIDANDPDNHRAKELLMKYSILPSSQTVNVTQKKDEPQILNPEDIDFDDAN